MEMVEEPWVLPTGPRGCEEPNKNNTNNSSHLLSDYSRPGILINAL